MNCIPNAAVSLFLIAVTFHCGFLFSQPAQNAGGFKVYEIHPEDQQTPVKPVDFIKLSGIEAKFYYNSDAVTYGGVFHIPQERFVETFSMDSLRDISIGRFPKNSAGTRDLGFHFGTGVQRIGDQFNVYSDDYNVSAFSDKYRNIFTVGIGEGTSFNSTFEKRGNFGGGLFMGAGNPFVSGIGNAKINDSVKIGALFPTGTGLLNEYQVQKNNSIKLYSSSLFLNKGWEKATFEPPDFKTLRTENADETINAQLRKERSYIAETNNYKNNVIKNFFPQNVIQNINMEYQKMGGESISENGNGKRAVTPRSIANFYSTTDPTGQGGPTQYFYSLPSQKTFEYATAGGFHYKRAPEEALKPISDIEAQLRSVKKEDIIAKQFVPQGNKDWALYSSVEQLQTGRERNKIIKFSAENGGTAESYKTNARLSADSALQEEWRKRSRLEYRRTGQFQKYGDALRTETEGLNEIKPGVADIKRQVLNSVISKQVPHLPAFNTEKINRASETAQPYLQKSRRAFQDLSFGMDAAQRTEFMDWYGHSLFVRQKEAAEQTYSASKTIVPELKLQNIILSQSAGKLPNFEIVSNNMQLQKKCSNDIGQNLSWLSDEENIFNAKHSPAVSQVYELASQKFQKNYMAPSNIEYAKAKMFAKEAEKTANPIWFFYAGGASLKSAFRALSFEGKEDSNVWKRAFGDVGETVTGMYVPGSALGERMISLYSKSSPPAFKDFFIAGAFQTIEDGLKISQVGGLSKASHGRAIFSEESLSATGSAFKNSISGLPVSAALTALNGAIDISCDDCGELKTAIHAARYAVTLTKKIGSSYKSDINNLEGSGLQTGFGAKITPLKNQVLHSAERELGNFVIRQSVQQGASALTAFPYFDDKGFLTGQLSASAQLFVPLTAGWIGNRIYGDTSRKQ